MDYVPAPFWRRAVARLIDLAICLPLTFACLIVVIPVTLILAPFMSDDAWAAFAAFLCYFLAYALVEYFLLRRRSGQTLGKGLLGLRVVSEGNPDDTLAMQGVSARSALLRMAVLIGPFVATLALYYATYDSTRDGEGLTPAADVMFYVWMAVLAGCAIAALVDRNGRRGLHDRAARTRVVRTARRGIAARDFKMLVPGKVTMETSTPVVTLTKGDPAPTADTSRGVDPFTKRP
jgi:uncharacterized RDD family membrane protein YckC